MDLLNGLIQVISDDFDTNNNSVSELNGLNNKEQINLNTSTADLSTSELKKSELDINKLVIDLLNCLKQWKKSIEFIESQCPLYDYKDIKANGYRSIFKANIIAIKKINKILSDKELTIKHLIKCLALAKLLYKINSKIEEYNKLDKEFKQNLTNNNESTNQKDYNISFKKLTNQELINKTTSDVMFTSVLSLDFFEYYLKLQNDLIDYYRYHLYFHIRKGLRKSGKTLFKFCSTSSNLPISLVFSKKKKSKVIAKVLNNPTFTFPFSVLDQLDTSIYKDVLIPIKYRGSNLSTETIYIPRQNKFTLNDINSCVNNNDSIKIDPNWSYELLKSRRIDKKEKIRIRIVKDKLTPKSGTIIFHIHGGAFTFHSPECHEIYLREFARKLPDVVYFSVAYRTKVKYPKGHQDCLDAYLWLTSGTEEVEEVIGFQPKKILFCGDSAGAFYSFSTLHLLTDFNKKIEEDKIEIPKLRLPDGLFCFYGYYNLTNTTPALFTSYLDFFLPPTNIRIAFGSLLWGVENAKFNKRICLPFTDKKKRWYDTKNLQDITNDMIKYFNDIPYLDTIHNFDFNHSTSIPIYILTSDMDLCLDHNIDIAKRWKGDVTMVVLEDLVHGFLQMEAGDKTIKEDIKKSINLLRTAIDKL